MIVGTLCRLPKNEVVPAHHFTLDFIMLPVVFHDSTVSFHSLMVDCVHDTLGPSMVKI